MPVKLLYSSVENTVIPHTFLKYDQSKKKTDFQEKPQIKQKNPRSSEKKTAVATLLVDTVVNQDYGEINFIMIYIAKTC